MTTPDHASSSRYSRQVLFPAIGAEGQARICASRVGLVGLGALGASIAEQLARAGVGSLVLIDRDVVEPSNLGRQALYDARDAEEGLPKAVALARHLERLNPLVEADVHVAEFGPANAAELLSGVDLVVDGTDNLRTRYLLNDLAIREAFPWIYGACVASRGMTACILPGETPCLRCLFPAPPPSGSLETCDTAGIIAPAATMIAALQVTEVLKLLAGKSDAVRRTLLSIELWPWRTIELGGDDPKPVPDCPACGQRRFDWLEAKTDDRALAYCGRDAVQIVPADAAAGALDLAVLEERLAPHYETRHNGHVLRVVVPEATITVFDDGRALVSGTGEETLARSLYDRYVGR